MTKFSVYPKYQGGDPERSTTSYSVDLVWVSKLGESDKKYHRHCSVAETSSLTMARSLAKKISIREAFDVALERNVTSGKLMRDHQFKLIVVARIETKTNRYEEV